MHLRSILYSISLLILLLASGCAPKATCPTLPWDTSKSIADLRELPQDPMFYADRLNADWPKPEAKALEAESTNYLQRFLAPWRQQATAYSKDAAFWSIASYGNKQGYGENLRPRDRGWFDSLVAKMNTGAFPSLAKPAIAVRNTALRAMPTMRPFFYDPREAGEGFPFDYFQNSALWLGTPVFVSHKSADGAWLYAEAPFAAGWVPARDLAFIAPEQMQRFRGAPYAAIIQDDTALKDKEGDFVATAHIGSIFPLTSSGVMLAPGRAPDGNAVFMEATAPPENDAPFPLPLEPKAIATVARELMGQSYGWGGMYEDRDCSAMVRDLFTPFGVWLPRNSKPQARTGRHIDITERSPADKEATLLEKGVPFRTLVGQPGHVMLFLGEYKGRAIIMHNIWGLRTLDTCGQKGRQIIGRAVITTLTPGKELEPVQRADYLLQKRIDSIAILGEGKE